MGFFCFCAGYIALLWAFSALNFYYSGFDTTGLEVLFYNVLRLIFVGYLFWMLYATGDFILTAFRKSHFKDCPILDRLTLGFFCGFGIWQITLLVLGLANLLHRELLVVLTFVVLLLSYPSFVSTVCRASFSTRTAYNFLGCLRETGFLLPAVFVSSIFLLTIVKGLYPAGGHDYYTHYFHYYREVVESGNIWPNNIWYHFYYSKGAGLFFLGMLLTDPLAPQLVTLSLFCGGVVCMAAFMARVGLAMKWRLIFLTLFIAVYIYTPGPKVNMVHGGWGDFEKLHELQTMLAVFLLYAFFRLASLPASQAGAWRLSAMLAMAAAIIITPPVAVFYALFCLFLVFSQIKKSNWSCISNIASVLFICVVTTLSILSVNYLLTGFPSDQGMKIFWRFVDFEKVQQWGVLPNFIILHNGITGMSHWANPVFSLETLRLVVTSYRLELFGGIILLAIPFLINKKAASKNSAGQSEAPNQLFWPLTSFIVAGCLIAIVFGRAQPISFYRFSSFYLPATVILAAFLWSRVRFEDKPSKGFLGNLWAPIALVIFCLILAVGGGYHRDKFAAILKNSIKFVTGGMSIASSYSNQSAWPGRLPWGGIYPAARKAHEFVPSGERLWSFHIHSYCMAPDCRVETYQSYKLGAAWRPALFGSMDESKAALKAAGLNYFLISTELGIADPLALSAPFRPAAIAQSFRVVWTDGVTALLTWKNLAEVEPTLNDNWVRAYAKRVETSKISEAFPYQAMNAVLTDLETNGQYERIRTLRWDRGLAGLLAPADKIAH